MCLMGGGLELELIELGNLLIAELKVLEVRQRGTSCSKRRIELLQLAER